MMRPSVQGVDPPVCCVLDVTVTYARDSFVDCQAGPFVLSRGGGGGQISWHQAYNLFCSSRGSALCVGSGVSLETSVKSVELVR